MRLHHLDPTRGKTTAATLSFGCRVRTQSREAEEKEGVLNVKQTATVSQSGCDTGKEFLTDGRSLFKKISRVQTWQSDTLTRYLCVRHGAAAAAAPSALSINNWFGGPWRQPGALYLLRVRSGFPNTDEELCWTVSCDTQMSRQDFGGKYFICSTLLKVSHCYISLGES